ncbi:hypothetical protein [Novosphingobium capsulatum]|uniref:hypothetical protein n=1 Tax=Novosphingobium capsulatum TaxID=13688 RepID=UPI002E0E0DBC|nr:hypothetical protein U0041_03705 [Novosphingobium capsulatum]
MRGLGHLESTVSLLSLLVICGLSPPASAQEASASAEAFAEAMASGVAVPDRAVAELPPSSVRALAGGYYKLLVRRADADGNDTAISCNDSIQKLTGSKKISDILTGKTSDVGISIELPLQGSDAEATKAELNLFRLTKTNGSNCRVEQSYFALRAPGEAFETPFMPLALNPGPDAQTAEIKFRPWSAQASNPARISALWRGVGAFAKLLGPIGALGSILFDDKGGDRYAVRAQAEASFFSATGLDPATDKIAEAKRPEFDRKLRIVPAKDGATPLNRVTASWDLVGKDHAATRISYVVDVDYLASRIIGGKQFKTVADDDFALLLEQASPNGQPWWSITPTVANLATQKDPKTFSAACSPALADLQHLNLSEPDRMLLLYAIGRAKDDFPADSFNDISCFSGKSASLALARFGIAIPPRTNPNSGAEMDRTARLLGAALRSPTGLGGGTGQRLPAAVKSAVSVRISPKLAMQDGKDFGDGTIAAARFLERFKQVRFVSRIGCQVNSWSDATMPPSSQLDSEQQPVAFLASQGSMVFLVVAGLATKVAGPENLPPAITSLYVSDAPDARDPVIAEIRNKMIALDSSLCPRDGDFAPFFSAPPVPPATAAGVGGGVGG